MNKTWLVARREYTYNLRRPAFLFGAFGVPVITLVIMFIVFALIANNETDIEGLGQVGYVDEAGVLSAQTEKPDIYVEYDSIDAARTALDNTTIGAYFVVASDYLDSGEIQIYSDQSVPSALNDQIDDYLVANLGNAVDDKALLARIKDPVDMTVRVLDSGRTITSDAIFGLFMVPLIFALVFYISTQTTSSYLMGSVAEEKGSRMMEILITSITPLQLLVGKIIGLGLLGLTQLIIWLSAGVLVLTLGQNTSFLQGVIIPLDLALIALLYFILSFFFYAGIMAGIGVSAGSEQESRQIAGFLTLFSVIPFFFFGTFLTDPESPVLVILTLFPFTAPLTAILRMSLGVMPPVQLIASLLIMVVSAVVVILASARVFRWASLMYGKRATPRELWRVIRGANANQIATVMSSTEEQSA